MKPTAGERREAVSIPGGEGIAAKSIASTSGESAPSAPEAAGSDSSAGETELKTTEQEPSTDIEKDESDTEAREEAGKDEKDDDSNEAVGKEEAAQDRDMMDDDDEKTDEPVDPSSAVRVTSMFQKMFSLRGQASDQFVVKVGEDDAAGQDGKLTKIAFGFTIPPL